MKPSASPRTNEPRAMRWLDDPWERYSDASDGGNWTSLQARHLLLRTGFGAPPKDVKSLADLGMDQAVERLIAGPQDDAFESEIASLGEAIGARRDVNANVALWLHRMLKSPHQLLEKMTLFWHGHFATSGAKVTKASLLARQIQRLRQHALGEFPMMVHEMARDPAMLIYLDSTDNRKTHPNENFARELMELFCLGIGNYTEQDIREVARCFTGWEVRRERFRFNHYQHDDGRKSFLGTVGKFDGDEAIDVILAQDAAAVFLAKKLVRYFVFDDIPIDDSLVQPLAAELRDTDFDISKALRKLLTSRLFYSNAAMGGKVRSPVELVIGTLRTLNASTNLFALGNVLNELGQKPMFPPNVKGWEGGRDWINSSTMLTRQNFIYGVATSDDVNYHDGSLLEWLHLHRASIGSELVDFLLETFTTVPIPNTVRESLVGLSETKDSNPKVIAERVFAAIGALPEFQLT